MIPHLAFYLKQYFKKNYNITKPPSKVAILVGYENTKPPSEIAVYFSITLFASYNNFEIYLISKYKV